LKWKGPEDDDSQLVTEPLARMAPWLHRALAAWLVILSTVSVGFLIRDWPEPEEREWKRAADSLEVVLKRMETIATLMPADSARAMIARELAPTPQTRSGHSAGARPISDRLLFQIALLCGVLGGCGHGLASLMDFRGQRRLFRSWALWYFALPLVGGIMAVIFFLLLRAGLFPNSTAADVLNPFGVGALSALAGLFTDKASSKLSEVLDTLFLSSKPPKQGQLVPPKPAAGATGTAATKGTTTSGTPGNTPAPGDDTF